MISKTRECDWGTSDESSERVSKGGRGREAKEERGGSESTKSKSKQVKQDIATKSEVDRRNPVRLHPRHLHRHRRLRLGYPLSLREGSLLDDPLSLSLCRIIKVQPDRRVDRRQGLSERESQSGHARSRGDVVLHRERDELGCLVGRVRQVELVCRGGLERRERRGVVRG